jgi:ABC-type sugar transport system substrate-binding protein
MLVGAALSVLALALAGPAAAAESVAGKTICYITAANSHFYVTPTNEGAQAAADAAGVKLTIVSEEFSPQTGADQLNSCVSRGVDGILLWPLDANSYLPGLLKAQQAGIPVVAIDTMAGEESMKLIASFVGADKYAQGQISAKQMNEALGGSGDVVIIAGQAGNNTTIARTDGFMAEKAEGINVLATVNADFDQQKALVASRDLLTKFGNQIDGVYAEDDAMAEGFLQALKESGLDFKPVVLGIGGMKMAFDSINAGDMSATIMQPPYENGKLAIETLIKVMSGETVDPVVPLENTVITSENIGNYQPAF